MTTYRPRDFAITALQFDGENIDELRKLASPELGTLERVYRENILILQVPERAPRLLHVGDWLSLARDGQLTAHSPMSFLRFWEPAEEPS